jgi:hypothetical protein
MSHIKHAGSRCAIAAGVTLALAPTLTYAQEAQDAEGPIQVSAGFGFQHDSNVAVLELDSAADAGDGAALLEFGLTYDRPSPGKFDIVAGYNYSDTLHEDYGSFDVRIHRGSSTLSYDLGRTDIGAILTHAYAELDGDGFLTLRQVSPYVSQLVGSKLFLRFAYARSEKDFAASPGRDATTDGLSADAYVFLNGLTSYLAFGYRLDDEAALDDQFDYDGRRVNVQYSRRLDSNARRLTLRTYLRFESRDYDNVTLSIGSPRRDDRKQLEASLEIPLGERWAGTVGYTYSDNRSNLPSVDFAENVWTARFRTTF